MKIIILLLIAFCFCSDNNKKLNLESYLTEGKPPIVVIAKVKYLSGSSEVILRDSNGVYRTFVANILNNVNVGDTLKKD